MEKIYPMSRGKWRARLGCWRNYWMTPELSSSHSSWPRRCNVFQVLVAKSTQQRGQVLIDNKSKTPASATCSCIYSISSRIGWLLENSLRSKLHQQGPASDFNFQFLCWELVCTFFRFTHSFICEGNSLSLTMKAGALRREENVGVIKGYKESYWWELNSIILISCEKWYYCIGLPVLNS